MSKICIALLAVFITTYSHAQQCDTLSFEWENPPPTTIVYKYGSGYLTGINDPANSANPTDSKTIFEGFTSPTPGTTPVGAVRIGLGFLTDPNDNTTFDVNVYNDASGSPGTLVGGATGFSPTQLGVPANTFSNIWITLPTGPIPTTSKFYVGIVMHPGEATDKLIIQSNQNGQGNGDGSNSITTSLYGNEKILTVYSRDIDLNIAPKLGLVEDPTFSYSASSYCPNAADPTPTISGTPGGTFSSSPAGLSLNAATGKIDLSASAQNTYTVKYTTNGVCPQSSSETISVEDNVLPVISCIGNQNVSFNSACQFSLPDYRPLFTATDNCAPPTKTQSPAPGTIISATQMVTVTAHDGNGNTNQCTFQVIPSDNTAPTIVCPANQTVSFDSNCAYTLPDYTGMATTADNCGTVSVTQSPSIGTIITTSQTVTLTVQDGNSNTNQCTFQVIPTDNTPPTLTCPGNQTIDFNTNCQYALPDYTNLGITSDNCSSTITVTQSPVAGTLLSATQTVTLTADDGNGNLSNCNFDVIPADNTAPSITCPSNQNISFDANCQYALPDYTALGITSDNCSSTITVTQSPVAGTLLSATQTVILTADDGNGNVSSCNFDVIPADNTPPSIVCPANQTISFDNNCQYLLPDYTALSTTSDNCSSTIIVTQSPVAGTLLSATQTVTLTANDGNGNTSSCTFDVIPSDNTPPVITCPVNQTISFNSNCQYELPDYTALSTTSDNCSSTITVTQSPVAGTILTSTQTVTLTADDGNGNVSSCSFDVLPVDTIAPTISCPADIIVDSDPGLCGAIVNFTPPIGTDNCTGATTVQLAGLPSGSLYPIDITTTTFQVTDAANNVATCSFNVVVTDSEAPSITCPAAIFTCDSIISFDDPVISDNCSGASYELSTGIASGNRFPVGLTTNIYTVTDASGNQASCPVEITRYPLPTIDAGSDQQIDAGKATLITTNSSKVEHFKWTPFTGLDDPTIATPLASPQQTTEYTVTVTSADGCTATDDVKIMVNLVIEANNFMSPNGDGKNDTWIIKGNYLLDECTIQLFDSWGNLVFEKRGYANDWDGNGLPEGVYYYVIRCGDQPTKSGSITLIR